MNTKQQNTLRSLLKKYKYKNASNLVRQAMGINFENFLQRAEPLYIIPRIASCHADEMERKRMTDVPYKEWIKDVVEKRWVEALAGYADEYGERTVIQAIYYLMDNGLWETYEGREDLNATQPGYYKLSDMPSAIAKVRELNPDLCETAEVSTKEDKAKESDGLNADDWVFQPDYIMSADDAVLLSTETDGLLLHLQKNLGRLSNYIGTAADSDVLRKKIDDQQKQIAELQGKVTEMQKKADEANATMSKASDYIAKLKAEAVEAQKEYDVLNAKYKKALDERDDADNELIAYKKLLEEEAQKEQMPRKKVIPQSVLEDVPLLGKGVMTGLVPVLARYNITVDPNR